MGSTSAWPGAPINVETSDEEEEGEYDVGLQQLLQLEDDEQQEPVENQGLPRRHLQKFMLGINRVSLVRILIMGESCILVLVSQSGST